MSNSIADSSASDGPDSAYAWRRLGVTLLVSTIGLVGMWSGPVVLPAVQSDFGVGRAEASLPYTLTMIGVMAGGILMGRAADRFGVLFPVLGGAVALGLGYAAAAAAGDILTFAAVHGVLIGMLGASAMFGPLISDVTHWFVRHRGIAVAVCACGSYLAGTVWPPVIQHFIAAHGWRATHVGIGVFSVAAILLLSLALRRP
ncbi:MAG: MFS transporter, partial [Alphaproteobacteria bacterium]|nr:MFS transporter [Alphaproteobacteria bacterium]